MRAPGRRAARPIALAIILILASAHADARTPATFTVRASPVARTYRAYAQIAPIAVTEVRAVEAGTVQRLVVPAEAVRKGQVLAILGGPQARSLLAQRRGALRSASIQLAADRRKFAAQLVTRQALAADEAAQQAARAKLQVALQTLTVRSAASGEVLAVRVQNGEEVTPGQVLLTLQTGRPWLEATYYGAQAFSIHPGMRGEFQPAYGSTIPVRVRTVAQAVGPDGGTQVNLIPAIRSAGGEGGAPDAQTWRSGMWGTLTLSGATRPMIEVPTRALILDRAQWWVLVRTSRGEQRRQVIPAASHGWMTAIASGLRPGEQIVVGSAYLEFHRGISQRYTPPD